MVTLAPLPDIAFSKNELNLVITSDDYIAVAGVTAENRMIFDGAVGSGVDIRLLWALADITIETAITPDESGNQFNSGPGTESHARAVMAQLADNFYISRDYNLTYGTTSGKPTIIFTAKKTGVLFNISPVATTHIAITNPEPGISLAYQPNFAHHVEVWLKVAGTFTQIYSENLQLDQPVTGITTKNIANEVLQPYLAENTDRPNLTSSGWQWCTGTLLEYYVKYSQYYGDQPTVKKLYTSAPAFINLGGLALSTVVGQTMASYLRPSGANSKTLCLRQGSRVKNIQRETPEFLYWANLTGADINIKLRIELFFDGGSQPYTIAPQLAAKWQKYYIAVGYDATNVDANLPSGKSCSYYTATVVDETGNFLSVAYTYVPDKFREWPRYFIYLNSLGGYSTLYTYGKGQASTDRSKDDIKKIVPQAQAATDGVDKENNIRIRQKCTVNTGYTTKSDIKLLGDFMVSPEKYFVVDGRLVPIGLTNNSINEAPDGDNLNATAFEFYPLYEGTVFTADLSMADNSTSGGGSGSAQKGFNVVRDDGKNFDTVFYDKNIII
jgi:hypothetical protein